MIVEILVLILLLALSAFFSGAELALFSLSPMRVQSLVKNNVHGAKSLLAAKSDPKKLLITILLGNNVVNLTASSLATVVAIKQLGSTGAGIATGIITFLVLVFGEITPKSIAQRHAESIALSISGVVRVLIVILSPFVWFLDATTAFVSKIGGGKKYTVTEEEVRSVVEIGAAEGGIAKEERELIERVLQFNDITVKDVMTPRTEMVCMDCNTKLIDALPFIDKCAYTRVPLYKKTKDNIVGILYVKDIIYYVDKKRLNITLRAMSHKPFFVPEGQMINKLFKEFQERRLHMAVVVDYYGGTAGIVTMEDLLEELVGDIVDESDTKKVIIEKIDKHTIKVKGNVEIDDINIFFNSRLSGKGTETVNAFLLKKLKKIPKKGEQVTVEGLLFTIDKASKKRAKSVIITRAPV